MIGSFDAFMALALTLIELFAFGELIWEHPYEEES